MIVVTTAIFIYGCDTKQPRSQTPERSTPLTIPFNEFAGATAEAGDADRHPIPPPSSRAVGDSFIHYVEHSKTQQDVIRFWFPEKPDADVMPVDYEILQSRITAPNGDQIVVDDNVAIRLVIRVFFQVHCDDYYSQSVSSFSFKRLGTEGIHQLPYPTKE